MTLGLDYVYRDFGKEKTNFTPTGTMNDYNPAFSADTKLKVSSIVARVNLKF